MNTTQSTKDFFAILGKNQEISLSELKFLQPQNIQKLKKNIICFSTKYPERTKSLGGCIKIGRIYPEKELFHLLEGVKIIGIQEETIGKHLKKTLKIKRFKLVEITHTDKEIKKKGKELINLDNGFFGIVEQYQDIRLYEVIDFEKPGRSMQMGMMPAKLTHIILNIGLAQYISTHISNDIQSITNNLIIYDPFVGSGTTAMFANYFGFPCIGSDINIQYANQNTQRRTTTQIHYAKPNIPIKIFQHDITKPLSTKEIPQNKDILIITEGRLGPIVREQSTHSQIQGYQDEVFRLYTKFLDMIKQLKNTVGSGREINAAFTIPYYTMIPNYLEEKLIKNGEKMGLTITSIPELYQRPGQHIARKILLLSSH